METFYQRFGGVKQTGYNHQLHPVFSIVGPNIPILDQPADESDVEQELETIYTDGVAVHKQRILQMESPLTNHVYLSDNLGLSERAMYAFAAR